ncbi:MAG: hypothetical protein ACHP9S_01555 [Terriglobales bacterium]
MAGVPLSKEDRAGLVILARLDESVTQTLLAEIQRAPDAVPAIASLSAQEAEHVMDALTSAYQARAYFDVPLSEFVSDVCETLRNHDELNPNDEPRFRERLEKFLKVDALDVAAKASVLFGEHEHLLCTARILTDARPVYGEVVDGAPKAFVLIHSLKIEYHGAGGNLHEMYFRLGSGDLISLRELIDRAEAKANSLREVFDATRIRVIDPQE